MITPAPNIAGMKGYRTPRPVVPLDLFLDGNEGAAPSASLLESVRDAAPQLMGRYPRREELEERIATRFAVDPLRVLVTAGGDEAIDRLCRAVLSPGRRIVMPAPTFEIIPRSAKIAGAEIVEIDWMHGPYPTSDVLPAITPATAVVSMVTPNNPTGAVASESDLRAISAALPDGVVLLDLAYTEFAGHDLTPSGLSLPNVVLVRTFSKAWGLAGLRVGFAIGPPEPLEWMRAAGGPYSASGLSLALAGVWLETGEEDVRRSVARVRQYRAGLEELLSRGGAEVWPSQGNFAFARFADGKRVHFELAARGISVRIFPGQERLRNCLRITCPTSDRDYDRLRNALNEIVPEIQALTAGAPAVVQTP